MNPENKKTVYILGAGFSLEAGAPLQAQIIPTAFEIQRKEDSTYEPDRFDSFVNFLSKQLNIHEDSYQYVALEDIFTPLDRCFIDSSQFRGINLNDIIRIRESVFYVVGKTIQYMLKQKGHRDDNEESYIYKFAKYLTKLSSCRQSKQYKNVDPVSVISTNWDILLDNAINRAINGISTTTAVVDYCCHVSSHKESDTTVRPGLEVLGEGGFNVKLLKLHGSLNWLQCPRCSRMYAKFSEKIGLSVFEDPSSCRHCDSNFPEAEGKHSLVSNLVMPTFLKDLSNPQYKIIWQNAGIEIAEASEIVFIGYSLPSADFDMRQLLSRMTRKTAKIHIVEYCGEKDKQKRAIEIKKVEQHWKHFFGSRELTFEFDGAKSYVENLVKNKAH